MFVLSLCLISGIAFGQDTQGADDRVSPNRPGFTQGVTTIPKGTFLIETGITKLYGGGVRTLSGFEVNVRYGLKEKWELIAAAPGYALDRSGTGLIGWSDSSLQVVRQLGPSHGYDYSVSLGSTLRTGNADLTAGANNPFAVLNIQHNLVDPWQWGFTGIVTMNHMDRAYVPSSSLIFEVLRDFTKKTGTQIDLRFDSMTGAKTTGYTQFTYIFGHDNKKQYDLRLGRQFSGDNGTNWFFGVGYSFKPF